MSYNTHESQILKYLMDAGGRALRPRIEKDLGIARASMTDIKDKMVSKGLIKVLSTFGNKTYWEISFLGKKAYQYGDGPIPEYDLPPIVEKYLEKKPGFKRFRSIQDTFIRRGLISSKNNVTAFGPPASGKTLIAEMVMIRELQKGGKVLYLTPYKALDRQKFKDFQIFQKFDFPVIISDGDHPQSQERLKKTRIILATYERAFGAVSACEEWLDDISLVCADEITLLGEDRGAAIDSLLTVFMTAMPSNPRIITLSSHIGNKFEVSKWLQSEPVIEDIYHNIDEFVAYRDGGQVVLCNKNGETKHIKTDLSVVEYLVSQNVANEETTLVFVSTRLESQIIAKKLEKLHEHTIHDSVKPEIEKCIDKIEEKTPLVNELCKLLESGIAFHHAGLPMRMRNLVEDLLQERKIKTVVCTTTLSHGIDYPVDNVIVFLSGLKNRWELDAYVCVQLEGRAGRPGKSKADKIAGKGKAYLITTKDDATRCMEKYVFGKPEKVIPDTVSNSNLNRLILVLLGFSKEESKYIEDITDSIRSTLSASYLTSENQISKSVKRAIGELNKQGMLEEKKGKMIITEIGEFMNKINVSPHDANVVVSAFEKPYSQTIMFKPRTISIKRDKKRDISDFALLHLACCIDVAKKMRRTIPHFHFYSTDKVFHSTVIDPKVLGKKDFIEGLSKALVLTEWINEIPLGRISGRYLGYDDQDVYQLGMYASRSLTKISQIARRLNLNDLAERTDVLSVRCRHGVKQDLAQSGIVSIRGIGRVRGRRLLDKGFDLQKLSKSTRELASTLKDPELQRSVIKQAKEMTMDERS